jgi:hypothetical protein
MYRAGCFVEQNFKTDRGVLKRLDTSQGLCITREHLAVMEASEKAKNEKATDKKRKREVAAESNVQARQKQVALATEVLAHFIAEGKDTKKLSVKHLKAAYRELPAASRPGPLPKSQKGLDPHSGAQAPANPSRASYCCRHRSWR